MLSKPKESGIPKWKLNYVKFRQLINGVAKSQCKRNCMNSLKCADTEVLVQSENKSTMFIVQKRLKLKSRLGGHWRVGIQAVGYAFKL